MDANRRDAQTAGHPHDGLKHTLEFLNLVIPVATGKLRRLSAGLTNPEKKPGTKSHTIENRFTFNPGQALFDGKDLVLPSDAPVTVLKKLVHSFGRVVPYTEFDQHFSSATPGTLPKSVSKIREAFRRHKVPCEIRSKTAMGYFIGESAPSTKRKERVRKRS